MRLLAVGGCAVSSTLCLRLTAHELCQGPLVWQMENLGLRLAMSFCLRNEVSRQPTFLRLGIFGTNNQTRSRECLCVWVCVVQRWVYCCSAAQSFRLSHILFYSNVTHESTHCVTEFRQWWSLFTKCQTLCLHSSISLKPPVFQYTE